MGVFDPIVEFKAVFSGVSLSSGQEITKDLYEVAPNEAVEAFRLEIVPPVDTSTGTVKKLREVGFLINGEKYPYIHVNSVMMPLEHLSNAGKAVDLGVPILWSKLLGKVPSPFETTTVKLKEGDTLGVYAVADESITQDFEIRILAARAKGADEIRKHAPPSYVVSFSLDADVYTKPAIVVGPDSFNELPGGIAQSKPAVYPWLTYARNASATTPNMWYSFSYPNYVSYEWQNLWWNLVQKTRAYLVKHLGVIPHSNSKSLRLYIEGRETNPEYVTRPLPEQNFFYPAMFYDTAVNADLKIAGPKELFPHRLFHGVKGGIQVIDNGTAIPANGVELHVYGVLFVLR